MPAPAPASDPLDAFLAAWAAIREQQAPKLKAENEAMRKLLEKPAAVEIAGGGYS